MRELILLAMGLSIGAQAAAQQQTRPQEVGVAPVRLDQARRVLQRAVDDQVAGSAVGLIARDGKIIFHRAFGAMEPGVPMAPNAICRMASIGKTITAVAVLILFEEGKLRLSDPVARFIPEFAELKVATADERAAKRELIAPERPVTIYDLLTHQSGLATNGTNVDQLWETAATVGDFAIGIAKIPLSSQPGSKFEYGHGYEVLAAVVERASGESFEEFLKTRVLAPLKMNDTSFRVPDEKLSRYAGVYQKGPDGSLAMFRRRGQEEAPTRFTAGGGGLRGTVHDYFRFAQMLLNGGELDGTRLLSPKTVQLMTADHAGDNIAVAGDWQDYTWGFGTSVRIRVREDGLGSVGAFGWNGGTGTLLPGQSAGATRSGRFRALHPAHPRGF